MDHSPCLTRSDRRAAHDEEECAADEHALQLSEQPADLGKICNSQAVPSDVASDRQAADIKRQAFEAERPAAEVKGQDPQADGQGAEANWQGDGQIPQAEAQRYMHNEQAAQVKGQASQADEHTAQVRRQGHKTSENASAGARRLPRGKRQSRKAMETFADSEGQDTISEACCMCQSAEDGEVMLLCDGCDQPAHLGCVGLETVPAGDWFCPSCTALQVKVA